VKLKNYSTQHAVIKHWGSGSYFGILPRIKVFATCSEVATKTPTFHTAARCVE